MALAWNLNLGESFFAKFSNYDPNFFKEMLEPAFNWGNQTQEKSHLLPVLLKVRLKEQPLVYKNGALLQVHQKVLSLLK